MKITRKITILILASTLSTSSFVKCDLNQKHKKHLAIGAYSVLATYSAKRTLQLFSKFALSVLYCVYPKFVKKILPYQIEKTPKIFALFYSAIYAMKFSVYGFLTYFAIKNVAQEIKQKDLDKKEASITVLANQDKISST